MGTGIRSLNEIGRIVADAPGDLEGSPATAARRRDEPVRRTEAPVMVRLR